VQSLELRAARDNSPTRMVSFAKPTQAFQPEQCYRYALIGYCSWCLVSRLIFAVLLLLAASPSQAAIKFYGEARLGASGVRHSELDFYPTFGSFSVGAFVFENIGIEGFVGTSISSHEADGFDLDVTQSSGAAVRLQSPAQLGGLEAYILLGYVNFNLEQVSDFDERLVSSSFNGVRVGIGVHQRLKSVNGLIFGVEYRNDFSDSGITVDGLSLGLRYEMP